MSLASLPTWTLSKASVVRATKKALKKRFGAEIYQGAKLFLSGLLNGRYPDTEILNLSRFISVMKCRPLIFRNTHPYLLSDGVEDLTPHEEIRTFQGKCDRTVTLYGYLRGTNLRSGAKIHIPGVGDVNMDSVEIPGDPCPLPNAGSEKHHKLSEKQKLLNRRGRCHASCTTRTRCGSMFLAVSEREHRSTLCNLVCPLSPLQTSY